MEDLKQERHEDGKALTSNFLELGKNDFERLVTKFGELARAGANVVLPTLDILGLPNRSEAELKQKQPVNDGKVLEQTDGAREEKRADQTRCLIYPNKDKVEFDSSGHASALVTADGVKREFIAWSLDAKTGKESPVSIRVTVPQQEPSEWKRNGDNWQLGEHVGHFSFEINRKTGEYSFCDNDTNETKRIVPGKFVETNLPFGKDDLLRRDFGGEKAVIIDEKGKLTVELKKK